MNETIQFMKVLDENGELIKYFNIAAEYRINKLDVFIKIFEEYLSSRDFKFNYKYVTYSSFSDFLKYKIGGDCN